ncbi:UDP-4-amino-4-deoxy-L-arabinose--oxoglutarate aminotransferase [Austwickia sp. TVS 96-490-7B]|uniref:DegT/DnrJ/EryC1/StrS family aminotransferase n=1 Tax=Austwickia sp. TVS 96-490-7B TaxID=2830843 RepID=UPI001C578616|nr:DegT/DnrJ/EryC1/StrS family aminotransferase [Austwickia sp. TVS 96-490-7B]MBW3085880.1 UDP-4-amino-4-deoxy-L-arabinose--oxoglutarate aminotransferase [Austwickia sp. TVS 96-490-7B]
MSQESHLPFALPDIGEEEIEAVVEAMRSGWLTTGPRAAAFEKEFAEFLGGGRTAIAVNSATAGLHLALDACGVGPGDEVIVPDWTFTSTAEVVRYLGADPVVVDVDPATLCLDYAAADRAVTSRTKAVMPVHFAGYPVDRQLTESFAAAHGVKVVEDAAHALPTSTRGQLIGATSSDATVFSFYATKTMTTGEGGMVVVTDPAMATRIRTMRLHGINRDVFDRYRSTAPSWFYEVVEAGYKYNLTDPAAAMGRVQLRRQPQMAAARASIAHRYLEAFADLPLDVPIEPDVPDSTHAWHLFVIRLRADAPVDRDGFIAAMAQAGVGTSVHFIPLHKQPYYRDRYHLSPEQFPVAEAEFARVVSLPIFSAMTQADQGKVVTAVRGILA